MSIQYGSIGSAVVGKNLKSRHDQYLKLENHVAWRIKNRPIAPE